jgi:lysophospholipase L1-like esterase
MANCDNLPTLTDIELLKTNLTNINTFVNGNASATFTNTNNQTMPSIAGIQSGVYIDNMIAVTQQGSSVTDWNQHEFNRKFLLINGYSNLAEAINAAISSGRQIYVPDGRYSVGTTEINSDLFVGPGLLIGSNDVVVWAQDKEMIRGAYGIDKMPTVKNIMFVGDSLTDEHQYESHASILAQKIAQKMGGFKQVGYWPLTTAIGAKQNVGAQFNLVKSAGWSEMWGASDHMWNQLPFSYSPDGRGLYTTATVGNEALYFNLDAELVVTKAKIYYLRQPGGGRFTISFSNTGAAGKLNVDTSAPTYSLGVAEVPIPYPFTHGSRINITTSAATIGAPVALYGVEMLNDLPEFEDGLTYNIFARSGSTTYEHNDLIALPTYYTNIAPDLVIINLGTNDALYLNGISATQFKSELLQYVDMIIAALPTVKIVIEEPNRSSIYGDTSADGQLLLSYTAKRKEVAAERSANVQYLDMPKLLGGYEFMSESGYMHDALHLNNKGKYYKADIMFKALGFDALEATKFPTLPINKQAKITLQSRQNTTNVTTTPVLLAKYGLVGDTTNAYFDLEILASTSGKMFVRNVRFYALSTSNISGGGVFDVRGIVDTEVFRLDASSAVSGIIVSVTKNGTNEIEITVAANATLATAVDVVITGTATSKKVTTNPQFVIEYGV